MNHVLGRGPDHQKGQVGGGAPCDTFLSEFFDHLFCLYMPSVPWRCWLGGRKGIRPVKKLEWWGAGLKIFKNSFPVWSEVVQTSTWPSWCHCHPLSLASAESPIGFAFWYRLTHVVPEKRPITCVCVCVLFCLQFIGCFLLQVGRQLQCWQCCRAKVTRLRRCRRTTYWWTQWQRRMKMSVAPPTRRVVRPPVLPSTEYCG